MAAIRRAPPAYPTGEVFAPPGVASSWWEEAWLARAAHAEGSVDTSVLGGR